MILRSRLARLIEEFIHVDRFQRHLLLGAPEKAEVSSDTVFKQLA